jgi:hypothetical protein
MLAEGRRPAREIALWDGTAGERAATVLTAFLASLRAHGPTHGTAGSGRKSTSDGAQHPDSNIGGYTPCGDHSVIRRRDCAYDDGPSPFHFAGIPDDVGGDVAARVGLGWCSDVSRKLRPVTSCITRCSDLYSGLVLRGGTELIAVEAVLRLTARGRSHVREDRRPQNFGKSRGP